MSTTLGLDIGTASIGWCLLEDGKTIKRTGVRIFPLGVNEDKSGTQQSKNVVRRTARGIRRLNDRYKLRRKELRRILLELHMLPQEEAMLARDLYGLRARGLDEKLSLTELGRVLLLLNQRRGFKSNRKAREDEDEKEVQGIKQQMNELRDKVRDLGYRTVGEYFYSLYTANGAEENWRNEDEPVERIRKRFVLRSMYEDEFDKLWAVQAIYYPSVLTEENRKRIKDRCIFYQRPLKSAKHLVGFCRFEKKKRVAHSSSLPFQEFRIWQTIDNIRVTDQTRSLAPLSLEEKTQLAGELMRVTGLRLAQIKTILGLPRHSAFNKMPQTILGATTLGKIREVIGAIAFERLSPSELEHYWHVLYFASDPEWLERYASEKLMMSREQASKFASIHLEEEYSRISTKAINNILPHLKAGLNYADACVAAGYHHSFDAEAEGKDRVLQDKISRDEGRKDEINQLRNPLVMRALSETASLVNAIIQEEGRPDRIRVEMARSLQMPKERRDALRRRNMDKERQREEYRAFLQEKKGWTNISKPQILKFELWLEMEFAEEDLRKIKPNVDVEEFRRFAKNVKSTDKEKYHLWLECGRISPYSGKPIPLTLLFSSEIEIEHILPYSKTMDDSFGNKTLCERALNAEKGNLTPYEFFSTRPKEFAAFKDRIKALPEGKQRRMLREEKLDDFRPDSLSNTAYIATESARMLKKICLDVRVTDGHVTSFLRRFWGLNAILNPNGKNDKSRFDNRHHAIDAFVIAATNDYWINLLNQASEFDDTGRMQLDKWKQTAAGQALMEQAGLGIIDETPDPLGLTQYVNPATGEIRSEPIPGPFENHRALLETAMRELLVSFRSKKRLLTSKNNKYVHSRDSRAIRKQRTFSVRGPLHAEKYFGQIVHSETGLLSFVMRRPLEYIKTMSHVEQIVDPAIRRLVVEHIAKNGGESKIAEAMKVKLFMTSLDGKKSIPINKVRMKENAKLVQLRPALNSKLFVPTGSNYCLGIYVDDKTGHRDVAVIPFLQAVKNKGRGYAVTPNSKGEQRLLFTIQQKDSVILFDKSAEEIDWSNQPDLSKRLYIVRKFSTSSSGGPDLFLDRHYRSKIDDREDKSDYIRITSSKNLNFVKVRMSVTGRIYPV